jgi:hypothetical protein
MVVRERGVLSICEGLWRAGGGLRPSWGGLGNIQDLYYWIVLVLLEIWGWRNWKSRSYLLRLSIASRSIRQHQSATAKYHLHLTCFNKNHTII